MTERIVADGEDGKSLTTTRIVVDGDSVTMPLMVGTVMPAEVTVEGGVKLTGTGHATIAGKKVCLAEDVKKKHFDYTYTKVGYTSGEGKMTIEPAAADHVLSATEVMTSSGMVRISFENTRAGKLKVYPNTPDGSPPSGSHEFKLNLSNDFVEVIKAEVTKAEVIKE